MRRLSIIIGAILLASPSPTKADTVAGWQSYIAEASLRFGIPEGWIKRVMRAESAGKTMLNGRPIRSHAGAMGLMQIMPTTWSQLTIVHRLGDNPDDPRANILGGTAYLRDMYDRFGYPGLFAAYNAGPARYQAYLQGKKGLPSETISYVRTVTGVSHYERLPASQAASKQRMYAPETLFYTVQSGINAGPSLHQDGQQQGLFAIRRPSDRDGQ